MERIEVNLKTGERTVIQLTAAEVLASQNAITAEAAAKTARPKTLEEKFNALLDELDKTIPGIKNKIK